MSSDESEISNDGDDQEFHHHGKRIYSFNDIYHDLIRWTLRWRNITNNCNLEIGVNKKVLENKKMNILINAIQMYETYYTHKFRESLLNEGYYPRDETYIILMYMNTYYFDTCTMDNMEDVDTEYHEDLSKKILDQMELYLNDIDNDDYMTYEEYMDTSMIIVNDDLTNYVL